MQVREKIRLLRTSRNWSREYLSEQLGMSTNGYGALERGSSNFTLDKLEKLAALFEMSLKDLVNVDAENVFNLFDSSKINENNKGNQGHAQFQINNIYSQEDLEIKQELEKQVLINKFQTDIIADKDKQLFLMQKMIDMLSEQK